MGIDELALANLRESSLSDSTIEKMKIRMVNVSDEFDDYGYIIPYFIPTPEADDYEPVMFGPTEFTRLRILKDTKNENAATKTTLQEKVQKYRQLSGSGNHVYLPPIRPARDWFDVKIPLIFTEGEKKAAAATQHGFLCAGLGGVYSWMSRRITVSTDAVKAYHKGSVSIDLKNGVSVEEMIAEELTFLPLQDRMVYLCFDWDPKPKTLLYVQKAAFDFALWLENHGATVRNVVFPHDKSSGKIGLDDFLKRNGRKGLLSCMETATFPTHPRLRQWINTELSKPGMKRSTYIKVTRAILAAIDDRGARYKDRIDQFYYFDFSTDKLHNVDRREHSDSFHRLLVKEFGIANSDRDIISRLRDEFESVPVIRNVGRVHKQSAIIDEKFCYQISDSRYVEVTDNGLEIKRNGDGILFEAGVHETDLEDPPEFLDEVMARVEDQNILASTEDINRLREEDRLRIYDDTLHGHKFGWIPTIQSTSIKPIPNFTYRETVVFLSCLFYLSPWLRGWKRLMLPVELAISEADSGKSSLYQLRKAIFCGSPRLNQEPESIRDWYASLANEPGLWVGDNVGNRMEDRISNEIARMITDPEPSFELRQLYTTNNLARVPVDCTFAFTGILNPFHKNDLIQRSVIIEFESLKKKDGEWLERHLSNRESWVAHQLDVIHLFLSEADDRSWDEVGNHRLVNFENALLCMGTAIGYPNIIRAAVDKLPSMVSTRVREGNPVMEGLLYFSTTAYENEVHNGRPVVYDISTIIEIIQDHPDGIYEDVKILNSSRMLGRFISSHSSDVYKSAALEKVEGMRNGKNVYSISKEMLDFIAYGELGVPGA